MIVSDVAETFDELLPPPHLCADSRIFHREATKKQLKAWRVEGHTWRADSNKNGVFGRNYPNKCLKELARICRYDKKRWLSNNGNADLKG
jgi:hypothetical protein